MAKSYTIDVEFHESFDGRTPVRQTLDVYSSGPEFFVLLEALNGSPMVANINVYLSSVMPTMAGSGMNKRLTRVDLGLLYPKVVEKIK